MSDNDEELSFHWGIDPEFELTDEMINQIKNEIIPQLKSDGINSSNEYKEANDDYEIDNVDLFQCIGHIFPADEILKINKNDYDNEDEYYEERDRKWNETYSIDELQLIINLGMDYLEGTEW